jgi:hypothetical protein
MQQIVGRFRMKCGCIRNYWLILVLQGTGIEDNEGGVHQKKEYEHHSL